MSYTLLSSQLPSWITPCREFSALTPGQLTQVCCTGTWEHQAGNPTKKCSQTFIPAIKNAALQGLVGFFGVFFRFYILDSLHFNSQNRFILIKACITIIHLSLHGIRRFSSIVNFQSEEHSRLLSNGSVKTT